MSEYRRQTGPESDEVSIDLVDLFVRFAGKWRTGLVTALISFAVALVCIFQIKPLFEAGASLLPGQTAEESSSLSAIFSGKRPGDMYIGLIRSRTVEDAVIAKVGLQRVYKTTSQETARGRLIKNTTVTVGTDSLVRLLVRDESATTAMQIANAYLDALAAQQESMALQQANDRMGVYVKQLQQEKDALAAAEQDLRKAEESTGVVEVQNQTQIGLASIANLRNQIATLQVQLSSLLLSSTEQNPQVRVLRSQIAQLESEERALETGRPGVLPGAALTAQRIPAARLEEARRQREVKYHEVLFNALSNQLQAVRLSAASSKGAFQIVDRAVLPEVRAWPPREALAIGSLIAAALLGLIAIVIHLLALRIVSDPHNAARLKGLRREFHLVQP